MTLYLYKIGETNPTIVIENVVSYTDNKAVTEDGTIYEPFADGFELSSLPDCSESLRASWKRENPSSESRIEELEALVADLLFGGETV